MSHMRVILLLVCVGVGAFAAALGSVAVNDVGGIDDALRRPVFWLAVALGTVAIAGGVATTVVMAPSKRSATVDPVEVIAARLEREWRARAMERGIGQGDEVLDLRWRPVEGIGLPVEASLAGTRRVRALADTGEASADEIHLGGGRRELFALYAGLTTGRVVIVGEPGAGKSAAAIFLLLDALAHRRAHPAPAVTSPVPGVVHPARLEP